MRLIALSAGPTPLTCDDCGSRTSPLVEFGKGPGTLLCATCLTRGIGALAAFDPRTCDPAHLTDAETLADFWHTGIPSC